MSETSELLRSRGWCQRMTSNVFGVERGRNNRVRQLKKVKAKTNRKRLS